MVIATLRPFGDLFEIAKLGGGEESFFYSRGIDRFQANQRLELQYSTSSGLKALIAPRDNCSPIVPRKSSLGARAAEPYGGSMR
jgi:hypothetical protein